MLKGVLQTIYITNFDNKLAFYHVSLYDNIIMQLE